MDNEPNLGSIVGVYKTGLAGEVTKVLSHGILRKYHVKIPIENETYLYTKDDLYVFPELAAENIRKEWETSTLIQEINHEKMTPFPAHVFNHQEHGKFGLIDKLKFMLKVF